jgi:DNA primase
MIDRFKLGFANRTLGYRLPAKNRAAGAEMRGRLQELGILRESGHEHFNGSVVIPVFNSSGEVVEMYGRKITPNLREGTPNHLYLPGAHAGVWNEEALLASKEIVLCESLIDALSFWSAGFRNVTASYGVNGFTADHRAAFEKHGTTRVYIAYDRDEAGEKATRELAEELMQMGIECFRILFPKGMDANEYSCKVQPAAKSLGVLLNKAEWLGNPYARELTFLDSQTRTRRDHMKYLTLIRSIALLHQWQRPRKTVDHRGRAVEYIEVTLADIATANRLAHEVLGRSLDELPPQTRRLLLAVDAMVTAECERLKMERADYRFSRRDVRAYTGWGDTQLKIHLHRLEEMEYLLIHRGGRGQSLVYELMFARPSDSGKPVLGGLIEVDALSKNAYDAKKSGPEAGRSGSSRPQVGGVSGVVKVVSPLIGIGVPDDAEFDLPEITYRAVKPNGHYVVAAAGVK